MIFCLTLNEILGGLSNQRPLCYRGFWLVCGIQPLRAGTRDGLRHGESTPIRVRPSLYIVRTIYIRYVGREKRSCFESRMWWRWSRMWWRWGKGAKSWQFFSQWGGMIDDLLAICVVSASSEYAAEYALGAWARGGGGGLVRLAPVARDVTCLFTRRCLSERMCCLVLCQGCAAGAGVTTMTVQARGPRRVVTGGSFWKHSYRHTLSTTGSCT